MAIIGMTPTVKLQVNDDIEALTRLVYTTSLHRRRHERPFLDLYVNRTVKFVSKLHTSTSLTLVN